MRLAILTVAPLPDTEGARERHRLHDLSEADVGKVMFHRRKQRHGDETLGSDQLQLGAVTRLELDAEGARMETFSLAELPESMVLEAALLTLREAPAPLIGWRGDTDPWTLIVYRCLRHRRALPPGCDPTRPALLDLRRRLLPPDAEPIGLDEFARMLGLPGMLGLREADLWDRWLDGETACLADHAEVTAVNLALLAIEIAHLRGECDTATADRARGRLSKALRGHPRHAALFPA